MARAKTTIVGLKLRMREPLRKKIEVAAKASGMSMNSEVLARLERSFDREAWRQDALTDFADFLREEGGHEERIAAIEATLAEMRGRKK